MTRKNLVSSVGLIDTTIGVMLVCLAVIAVVVAINWGTGQSVVNDDYVTTTTTIFITQEGG